MAVADHEEAVAAVEAVTAAVVVTAAVMAVVTAAVMAAVVTAAVMAVVTIVAVTLNLTQVMLVNLLEPKVGKIEVTETLPKTQILKIVEAEEKEVL